MLQSSYMIFEDILLFSRLCKEVIPGQFCVHNLSVGSLIGLVLGKSRHNFLHLFFLFGLGLSVPGGENYNFKNG